MKLIAGIRKVLHRRWIVLIEWVFACVLLAAWAGLADWDITEGPAWAEYLVVASLALLFLLHFILEWTFNAAAERIARKRLRAAEPYYQNANTFRELGDYNLAVAEYGIVIGIDPDNARAYTGRGGIYDLKEDHALAIADYTTAIEMDPYIRGLARLQSMGIDASDYDLAWAYYYRGCSYRSKGEFDLASRDFEAAISVDSSGFPKDLAYIDLPLVQHDKPEDSRVVHYVKPCKAVREAGELNFLCSKYYLGVNCDACLQEKPSTGRLIAASPMVMLPVTGMLFAGLFLDDWILTMLVIPTMLIWLATGVVETLLNGPLGKTIKPLTTRVLARPFTRFPR